jgi:DNA-binding XRE family transcriptional regulator
MTCRSAASGCVEMWPPHINSSVPQRERRLRVRLAAGMIADVDDPPGMWMAPANLDATQCKMARAALGIGVQDLAVMAGVSPDAVFRLEKGETLHQRTVIAIREALELAGVELIDENGGGSGVRLRRR